MDRYSAACRSTVATQEMTLTEIIDMTITETEIRLSHRAQMWRKTARRLAVIVIIQSLALIALGISNLIRV